MSILYIVSDCIEWGENIHTACINQQYYSCYYTAWPQEPNMLDILGNIDYKKSDDKILDVNIRGVKSYAYINLYDKSWKIFEKLRADIK